MCMYYMHVIGGLVHIRKARNGNDPPLFQVNLRIIPKASTAHIYGNRYTCTAWKSSSDVAVAKRASTSPRQEKSFCACNTAEQD